MSPKRSLAATWSLRALAAVGIGLVAGGGGGFVLLSLLEPPPPTAEERAAIAEAAEASASRVPTPRRRISGPRADGSRQEGAPAARTNEDDGIVRTETGVVPALVGMGEGEARRLLERVGFEVGNIMFQTSGEPTGTVLATFPVPGERVELPAVVNLILSQQRRTMDTRDSLSPDSVSLGDSVSTVPDSVVPDPVVPDSVLSDPIGPDSTLSDPVVPDSTLPDPVVPDSVVPAPTIADAWAPTAFAPPRSRTR